MGQAESPAEGTGERAVADRGPEGEAGDRHVSHFSHICTSPTSALQHVCHDSHVSTSACQPVSHKTMRDSGVNAVATGENLKPEAWAEWQTSTVKGRTQSPETRTYRFIKFSLQADPFPMTLLKDYSNVSGMEIQI